MTTAERIVAAAAELLDKEGEAAVTLRRVGAAVGLSHNASNKHFANHKGLLAGVATADFNALAAALAKIRQSRGVPTERLLEGIGFLIRFSQEHPARYHLLFGDPAITAQGGALTPAADGALREFTTMVEDCQADGALPAAAGKTLAILLFATTHGLIQADAHGRLRSQTGWDNLVTGVQTLLALLGR